MDRQQPSGMLPSRPFMRLIKVNLALGFLFLILFSGYQPQLTYPPIKKNQVNAQEVEQTKTVTATSTTLAFQAPHPGYLSTRYSSYHPGIDLATGLGMPIKPIAKGTVISTGLNFWGLGLVVEVDHGEGYRSVYAHMGSIYVKNGQTVDSSSQLGVVGMTGNTSGPHTHLEVYKDGKAIDPAIILPPLRNQPQESDFVAIGGTYSNAQPVKQTPSPQPTTTPTVKPKTEITKIDVSPLLNNTPKVNPLEKITSIK